MGITIAGLLLLVVGLLIFIRSPWGQDIIVKKAVSYLADKTGTEISIERLFVTFKGDLHLEGFYVEDLNQDTLVYSKKLETGLALKTLITKGGISVSKLEWEGVRANVRRDSIQQEFNFDFIIKAFAGEETGSESVPGESSPLPAIALGPVDLKDFNLSYDDQVLGIQASALWEKISIRPDHLDLNKMDFGISELTILDSRIDYFQYKPFDSNQEEEASDIPLPLLVLDKLQVSQADWNYTSLPDGIKADARWNNLFLSLPEANLEEQKILMKSMELSMADISLDLQEVNGGSKTTGQENIETADFSLPDWWIEVGNMDLENSRLAFTQSGGKVRKGQFNPDAVYLDDLNVSARQIYLKEEIAGINIDKLLFIEGSGLKLNELQGQLSLKEKGLKIQDFLAVTGNSSLDFDLNLSFLNLNNFIQHPEKTFLDLDLREFKTDASEALYFSPELGSELYFQELMANGISLKGKLKGDVNQLNIPDFSLDYGTESSLVLGSAVLNNLLDIEGLRYDIPELKLLTRSSEVQPYLADMEYNLPEEIQMILNAKGGIRDFIGNLTVLTSDGVIKFNGNLDSNGIYALESTLSLNALDVGKILNIPDLAPLTMAGHISGKGNNLYDLEGRVILDIDQLIWNENDFSSLEFQLMAQDTMAELNMAFNENYFDFELDARASLDSLKPGMDFNLVVDNFQSRAMGLTQKDITGKININGLLEGPLDSLLANLRIEDSFLYHEQRTYPIGDFEMTALLSKDLSELRIDSDFLEGFFKMDASVDEFITSIRSYLELINTGGSDVEEVRDFRAEANLWFHPTPFIDKLLVDGIEEIDSLSFVFNFDSRQNAFSSRLNLDKLHYEGAMLDSFFVEMKGNANAILLETTFNKLQIGPVDMPESHLLASYFGKKLDFEFFSQDDKGVIIDIFNHLDFSSDTLFYHVKSDKLIFNREPWLVPADNLVAYAPGYLGFRNFSFSQNDQNISFTNSLKWMEEDHLGVSMKNFEVNSLLGFLNPYKPLFSGKANGEVVVVNPFEAIGLIADLNIGEIEIIEIPFGTLELFAESKSLNEYDFSLSLKEGMTDLDLIGSIQTAESKSNLDMRLDLHELKVELLELLSDGELKNAKGIIKGSVSLNGTLEEPRYQGELNFVEASILISQLNNRFDFPNENIKISNSELSFTDFSIKDEQGQVFTVNGKILTDDLADIGFDLRLFAENFQLLNSSKTDNDLFFGKALVDLDLKIGGSVLLPKVDAKIKVNRGTELTLILPEDQLNYMERTGIVLFVNHEDPYDILYQRDSEIVAKGIQGYDITANLQVDPQTVLNLIVDEKTNDNLRIQGQADLNLLMDPNGDISLSGRYEVRSGHYELNLFGLVNRRFLFAQGSSIIWTGDVLDANLNITTIYNVRTSPAELMQAQLSGTTTDARSQFRQILPFMVYLKIKGELLEPELSFELDMPEESRGSFDGNVYTMIQQVNQREDELNKQVFSLLVLNQFFPMMGNDGSTGGSVNLAKSSANQILSSQLNTFSDRLFGDTGFSLDFDLDTYTDYQTGAAEDRTQLNVAAKQKLMDDRLIISVGGQVDVDGGSQQAQQGNSVFGDVSLEYLLDERGRWRVTTFRKNQFESVIDGQLIITGISFIFTKEFNSFMELLRKSEEEVIKEKNKKDRSGEKDSLPEDKDSARREDENNNLM